MYKVFLVDDEIVIREGIRNNFPWDESAFTLCGEAPDGEIALSQLLELRPDILITDIRMPFMDGMTLCRSVARTMPWMHIVILSGYDDFTYAREAITLGVKEYLLKPVSVQQLLKSLERIAGLIENERAQRANLNELKRQLASSAGLIHESLLSKVLDGTFGESMMAEARSVNLSLTAGQYTAMVLRSVNPENLLALRAAAQRLADNSGGTIALARRGAHLAALVLGDNAQDVEERAYAFAQAVTHEHSKSQIAIGSMAQTLQDIPSSVQTAFKVLQAMGEREARILGAADIDDLSRAAAADSSAEHVPELMQAEVVLLYDKLRFASVSNVAQLVNEYFASLGKSAAQSILIMHYALVDILLACSRIIKKSGADPTEVLPETRDQSRLLGMARSADDITHLANDIIRRTLLCRDAREGGPSAEVLRRACAYIEENYQRAEMTLHDVAGAAGLSDNHFCTVFSQKMGMTFLEYLTRLRMTKAQSYLLETDLRSIDIAERIGYTDTRYFRYLFKKNTGVSPREFRSAARDRE
ncbi:MAG: response regulator [Oscillospiraceae bacterium]|jgi:two-component system response regulator YesN|nr:response regulator [Oscillospiraceae bacterium]